MDNTSSNQGQLWKQCPKGILRQVADRSANLNRCDETNQFDRRKMLQIAAAVAVTAGAGTIAYHSLFNSPSVKSMGYGGISCAKFISNMQKYIDEGLEDQELVACMDKHLELCKGCQARHERMLNS